MSIEIKKVSKDGPDRVITTSTGSEFYLKKEESGYSCNGEYGSLLALKQMIKKDQIPIEQLENVPKEDIKLEMSEHVHLPGTFDCIEPCALLVMYAMNDDVLHTLDKYGWLDENEKPDVARAKKEIKRFRQFFNGDN